MGVRRRESPLHLLNFADLVLSLPLGEFWLYRPRTDKPAANAAWYDRCAARLPEPLTDGRMDRPRHLLAAAIPPWIRDRRPPYFRTMTFGGALTEPAADAEPAPPLQVQVVSAALLMKVELLL